MSPRWERICRVDEVPRDSAIGRVLGESGQDRDRVCVATRKDGSVVAMLDRCPHRDIALSGGVTRDGTLVCPGHFWRFDLATGERTDKPQEAATIYPTRVVGGWVEAFLPPPAARMPMREWLLHQSRGADSTHPPRPTSGTC